MKHRRSNAIYRSAQKIKQDQAAKAAEDARLKASRQANREALDCLKELVPAAREALEREFALYLSKTNTMAAMFFKRSGFQNPLVISQFKTFTTTPLAG